MPGTPRYPKEMGIEWMDLKRSVKDAFTSANSRVPFRTIAKGFLTLVTGGLKVYDDEGVLQVQVGKLPNGNYGIGALNTSGSELVELNTIALGLQVDTVWSTQSTTSSSMTDLATYGPSVTVEVGSSGRCVITLGAQMSYTVPGGLAINTGAAYMGFEINGPGGAYIGPDYFSDLYRYDMVSGTSNFDIDREVSGTREFILEGIYPGTYTFTAKYMTGLIGATATFGQRVIKAQPY